MGLKVVFVDHVARLSGAEIAMARLIRAADELQATVILAEDGPLAPALREAGAQVEILPMAESARGLTRAELQARRTRLGASAEVARYTGRLRKRLVELKPDIVHTNSLKSGVYGTAAARLAGLPSVWSLQDHLTPEYLPPQVAATMRLIVSTAPSALVVPSQSTLRAVGTHRRPGLRVAVIPHPVPMPNAPATVAAEVRTVGVVGRLTPWKGQHVFLDAFAQAFPEPPVRARLVGSAMFGEEAYDTELRAQAERLGIADRVDFVGFVDDVDAELRGLDLLVHCSVLPDPLAISVLEGMAAGMPMISAGGGGHVEYVVDGRDGLLHKPGDAEDLAAALRRAAGSESLRVAIASGARKQAANFTPEAVVEKVMELYGELTHGGPTRGRRP